MVWVVYLDFSKSSGSEMTNANVCHKVNQDIKISKLNSKQKLFRTLGFFLDFFPQLILTSGSRDMPPTYHVTL